MSGTTRAALALRTVSPCHGYFSACTVVARSWLLGQFRMRH
uniref:Uncharacterized protein n=1 Tax=Arundo donax TaxID=35708 RepID=A0A0A9BUX0_ARUDO